jgi:hypothetical protein
MLKQIIVDIDIQKHIDSLSQVPGGDQNSPFQDLDGEQGPSFDNGSDSTLQQDSLLQQYNYSHGGEPGQGGPVPNTSPYQDLNGVDNGNGVFDNGMNSTLQQNSLVDLYQYQYGNSPESVGPATLDLNGAVGPQSQLPIDDASQKHIDSLSQVPGFSSNSPFQDLNINLQQGTPGQYLNNMPD